MISVCIATHNGEKYIKEQIDSILQQLDKEDEIVISDDGSTDRTLDIIKSYDDPRISIHQIKYNVLERRSHYYVTKNFENTLYFAKGDYIFLADQDDIWIPNKVKLCIEELRYYDLVISNLQCVDSQLHPLGHNIYGNKFRFHNFLMLKGKYYGCAMAFKRKVLDYVLPFPNKLEIHDFWIGILTECLGKVLYINTPLVKYRMHNENTSSQQNCGNSLYFKLSYRIYTMWNVFIRCFKFYLNIK